MLNPIGAIRTYEEQQKKKKRRIATRCRCSSFPTCPTRGSQTGSRESSPCGCSSSAHATRGPISKPPAENADAIAELRLRLDGLPLALELAAARIKLLAPIAILERLGGRLDLLKAAPGAGMPERHRTLRAATEWSYDLLTTEEQQLFTSIAVFVGGFTLDGAGAVTQTSS